MKIIKITVTCFIIVFILFSCGESHKKKPEIKSTVQVFTSIMLDREQLKSLDITLSRMEDKMIYPYVYANGVVAPRPNNDAAVTPRISGVIDEIFILEGSNVKKGQALMSLSSTELIQMQQDYMSALADAHYYEKEFERQTTLKNANVGALSEYQLTESKYLNSVSLVKTLKAKLALQGVDSENLNDPATATVKTSKILRAPISGFVHNIPAKVGMRAEPSSILAEVLDLSDLRADIYVYEKDLNLITENQEIEIQFINKSIPNVPGKIEYVSRTIDKETHSIVMHTSFKSPKGYLVLPEMSITARIKGMNSGKMKKTIPMTAIFDESEQSFIFYTTAADTAKKVSFRKAKVKVGSNDGSNVELEFEEPVPMNCQIVTSNVINIESEFKKQESSK